MNDQSQRTEKATPRRIEKAREQGDFVQTQQLLAGVQFFLFAWLLTSWGGIWFRRMGETMRWVLRSALSGDLEPSRLISIHRAALLDSVLPVVWAGVAVLAFLLLLQLIATQFGISLKRLEPKLERMNPAQRLSGVIHANLSSLVQALVLLPLFGYILHKMTAASLGEMLQLPRMGLQEALLRVKGSLLSLIWQAACFLLLFGIASYGREYMRYMKKLRMSKQEMRDEAKESEGNPLIKGRIRRIRRDLRNRRMLQDIPTATAVVVNPTHYSVAIRYAPGTTGAPVVVAKGKNLIAQRIRQLAVTHGVPIVENPPLARGLYSSVEVGNEIPPYFYKAVAEVLSLLIRLAGRQRS